MIRQGRTASKTHCCSDLPGNTYEVVDCNLDFTTSHPGAEGISIEVNHEWRRRQTLAGTQPTVLSLKTTRSLGAASMHHTSPAFVIRKRTMMVVDEVWVGSSSKFDQSLARSIS